MNLTILGAGAWGSAVAINLAQHHRVLLWGRDADAMNSMAQARENRAYLPGYAFPPGLQVTADFDAALAHARSGSGAAEGPGLLIIGTPVAGLRPLVTQMQHSDIANLIWLCKGFEMDSQKLPHQIVREIVGPDLPIGVLSGPSFAQEVAQGLPCALTIASESAALREKVVASCHGGAMRIYSSTDVIGVEVGGAVKNILAIATGIADGLGLGLNARAALITRGLAEIRRLGTKLGGHSETFMGLTGIGDLILTCTGDLSRNRRVGLGLAAGKPLARIVSELGHVAEGIPCARAVRALAADLGIEMPLTNAVAGVLFDGDAVQQMVTRLMARDPRDEAT
jgi:glycerol-3-phosphate dehydrogenase (NAD(P)+)